MKKIFFFIVLSVILLSINSCSNNNDSKRVVGTISFKANGVQKNYSNIDVTKTDIYTGDLVQNELDVYGFLGFENLHWHLQKNTLDDTVTFLYTIENVTYTRDENFTVTLTSNGSDNKLIGTFSGDLVGPTNTITITEGVFSIQY